MSSPSIAFVEVREATYADLPSIEAVAAAAFEEEPDGRVVTMMRALAAGGAARVSLVALSDEEIVGHVGLSRGWIDARRELVDALVLSPLSVRPDVQRRGIGSVLVAAALEAAVDRGAPAVFLEGDGDFYGARGFSPGASVGFESPSARIPERAFQVALLPRYEPWMVGRLIYPEAFWVTGTVGLRDPRLARVEVQAGGPGSDSAGAESSSAYPLTPPSTSSTS